MYIFPTASTEPPPLSPNECEDNLGCDTGSFCQSNSEGIRQCQGMCSLYYSIIHKKSLEFQRLLLKTVVK